MSTAASALLHARPDDMVRGRDARFVAWSTKPLADLSSGHRGESNRRIPSTRVLVTPDSPLIRFEIPISIAPEDIDDLGHVNNVVYVRWVQDVAIAHWRAAATERQQEEIAWVAIRHEIDYKHPAVLTDGVVARTWVGTADAVRFERHTEIVRAADQKILARSRTLWCPINRQTGRLTRADDELRRIFSVPSSPTTSG